MKSSSIWLILLVAVCGVGCSVPDEFCLDHFDDGDCGKPPTSVLYYYKPGSRCEVRTWRGCPTLNKFPDYFSCVHFCVGRIWGNPVEIPVLSASAEVADNAKAVKMAGIIEALNDWKQEIKELKVEEIKMIDAILAEVVEEVHHHHNKLSLYHENSDNLGSVENDGDGGDDEDGGDSRDEDGNGETTTELPSTGTESFTYEEEEVIVP